MHIMLWHRGFWFLAIANFLIAMSVYCLVPVLPRWLMSNEGFTSEEAGIAMGAFGVGLFVFGGFCSYLIQTYRRNRVCMESILVMAICTSLLYYLFRHEFGSVRHWWVIVQRILFGAVYGLAEMVLSSTLIIDKSESFVRTEANHSAAWFSRFAVALGPLGGLLAFIHFGTLESVLLVSDICALSAILFIRLVNFPFRTPGEDTHVFSLDRFFLPQGFPLFVNIFLIMMPIGMIFALPQTCEFYALMMGGFALALLSQRFVFPNSEVKSEVVTAMPAIISGMQLLQMLHISSAGQISPVMIGMGIGIIGARFLLFFIKLSRHCQRGTSSSTFFLGWESSIAIGIGVGYYGYYGQDKLLIITAMSISAVAFVMYLMFTHRWYMLHKNR